MTEKEALEAFPWLQEHWRTVGGFFARPPGGESIYDVVLRVKIFLDELNLLYGGQRVWVVIHGIALRALMFWLDGITFEQAQKWPGGVIPENCSVTRYEHDWQKMRLVLQEYNKVVWQ